MDDQSSGLVIGLVIVMFVLAVVGLSRPIGQLLSDIQAEESSDRHTVE